MLSFRLFPAERILLELLSHSLLVSSGTRSGTFEVYTHRRALQRLTIWGIWYTLCECDCSENIIFRSKVKAFSSAVQLMLRPQSHIVIVKPWWIFTASANKLDIVGAWVEATCINQIMLTVVKRRRYIGQRLDQVRQVKQLSQSSFGLCGSTFHFLYILTPFI